MSNPVLNVVGYAITGSALFSNVKFLDTVSFAENAADPGGEARILLRDGSVSGTILADIRLAAKGSVLTSFARPLSFPSGLYVQVSVGTVRGAVHGRV